MSLDTTRHSSRPGGLAVREVRERLEHERASRLVRLTALEEIGPAGSDEPVTARKAAIRRVLTDIDAAFARLEGGTYGICRGCAEPIPAERLEILPYARCCVGCLRRPV